MIIVVKNSCEHSQFENLMEWIKDLGLDVHVSRGVHTTILGLVGDTSKVDIDLISSLDMVDRVQRVQEPYKNANRKFHPEDTVVEVGDVKIGGLNFQVIAGPCSVETEEQIIEVAKAAQRMSDKKIGSLVVFEKETHLGDVIKTGTAVDAKVTHELVGNIFFPNSPLHDGASIIRDGRLLCSGCVLPLTKNENISRELGTRHRAAIGISEVSDAIVVITSEETGIISYAVKGELIRDVTEAELREVLLNSLIDTAPEKLTAEKDVFKKLFKGWKK